MIYVHFDMYQRIECVSHNLIKLLFFNGANVFDQNRETHHLRQFKQTLRDNAVVEAQSGG